MRLGTNLKESGENNGEHYFQADLTVLSTLLTDRYLGKDENHQGIIFHSVYHRPNKWDYVPEGSKLPNN